MNSGTISAFLAGTTTATPMYSDIDGTSAGSVITLNARGEPEVSGNTINIYLDTTLDYKLVLKDASGVAIWTVDDITVEVVADPSPYGGMLAYANSTAEAAISAFPPVVIAVAWVVNTPSAVLTPDYTTGVITVPTGADGDYRVWVSIDEYTGTASKTFTFAPYKNDDAYAAAARTSTTTAGGVGAPVNMMGVNSLVGGDTYSVKVFSQDGGTSVTIAHATFFIERIGV